MQSNFLARLASRASLKTIAPTVVGTRPDELSPEVLLEVSGGAPVNGWGPYAQAALGPAGGWSTNAQAALLPAGQW